MPKQRFREAFPNIDHVTEWYLEEVVDCLERYANMSAGDAYHAVISSENLSGMLRDDHQFIQTEPAFYWAMCIVHGFDSLWWHNKRLKEQHNQYVKERHHPPADE